MKVAHFKPNEGGPKPSSRGQENVSKAELDMDFNSRVQNKDPKYHFSFPAYHSGSVQFGATFPSGHPPDHPPSNVRAEALASTQTTPSPNLQEDDCRESFWEASEDPYVEDDHSMDQDSPRKDVATPSISSPSKCC